MEKREARPSHHSGSHDLSTTPTSMLVGNSDKTEPESKQPSGDQDREGGCKAVPESVSEVVMLRANSVYLANNHKHARSTSNRDSEYATPPSTPTLDDGNSGSFEPSKACGTPDSLPDEKLGSLESVEMDQYSEQQILNLKYELYQVSQENYAMQNAWAQSKCEMELEGQLRVQEKDALINNLYEQIKTLQQQLKAERAASAKAQECKLDKIRRMEKVQRDKESFEKKQLTWEKEEACRQKLIFMEDNGKLRERLLEMKEDMMKLYGDLKHAYSYQFDENGSGPESRLDATSGATGPTQHEYHAQATHPSHAHVSPPQQQPYHSNFSTSLSADNSHPSPKQYAPAKSNSYPDINPPNISGGQWENSIKE